MWTFAGISDVDLFEVDFENGEFRLASRVTKRRNLKDITNYLNSKVFDREHEGRTIRIAVSYTHLTLPTKLEV